MRCHRVIAPALAAAIATFSAHAQTTSAQASALEAQITTWLQSLAGTDLATRRVVEITPDGARFAVRIPLAAFDLQQLDPADAAFTAHAEPLGGTRYRITDQHLTSPVSFTVLRPVPGNPSSAALPVHIAIALGQQDQASTVDTAFATPTSSSGTIASADITVTDDTGAQATHLGPITTQASATPADPAHVDILIDSIARGFFNKSEQPDGTGVTISADTIHISEALSDVAHDRLLPLFQQLTAFARIPVQNPGHPTPEQQAALRSILVTAKNLLTGGKLDESMDGMKIDTGTGAGAAKHLALSLSGTAPADTLSATLGFVVDGLTIDDLPPQFAAFMPTHFSIRPSVSNLNIAALTSAALAQTAPDDGTMQTMFATGGITFGFDQLELDMAGLELRGSGQFSAKAPGAITGQADITAHGLDGLIARAQAEPALQSLLPSAFFLKGIAKVNGDQALWQITLTDGRVLVNGVDTSAMTGGNPRGRP